MSDTNWFDLVHLIHNTQLFTSLNIGANRASQTVRLTIKCARSYDYDSKLILTPLDSQWECGKSYMYGFLITRIYFISKSRPQLKISYM